MRSVCLSISKLKWRRLEFTRSTCLIVETQVCGVHMSEATASSPETIIFPRLCHFLKATQEARYYAQLFLFIIATFSPPPPPNHVSNSLAGWRNINMLNNLMKVHVPSCTHTHTPTPTLALVLLHGRTEPRWQTRAHTTLKYHLINGQTVLMRTHLHLIIITLLHFSKSVTLLHLDSSPAITRRHFIKLH